MKRIFAAILTILLLLGLFAGCQAPANAKNVLVQRIMTQEEKDAFIYYQAALHGQGSELIYPFYEDFGYGYSYLGTINGWDILYKPDAIIQLETTDNEVPPYLTLGNVVFEGAYYFFFPAWNGTERKFIDELYESGEINDEPLQDLFAAYKETEQKRQATTSVDARKGRWAFKWLYWDITANKHKFPWYSITDEELPWGLLPDEVIEGRLHPDEWKG